MEHLRPRLVLLSDDVEIASWFADDIYSVPHPSENLIQLRIQMYGVYPRFIVLFMVHLM